MRKRRAGVFGPYAHRRKWRIDVVAATGERHPELFDTEAEALAVIRDLRKALGLETGVTAQAALDEYELTLKSKGNKPGSVADTVYRIGRMLGATWLAKALRALTPEDARRCYAKLAAELAVDSHRNMLAETKTFMRWAVSRKHIRASAFEDVEGTGRRVKGKDQLRNDEGRRVLDACVGRGIYSEPGRIAVAVALTMGLRSGEIRSRVVRDLDDGGTRLWIPFGKTRSAKRQLQVPDFLQPHLLRFATDKLPTAPLFGGPHDASWLRKWAKRICAEAGVGYICPHGMRGSFATSALNRGATPHEVAADMGHASPSMTTGTYAAPGAGADAEQERRFTVMRGGKR
jgi:integrase